MEHLGLFSGWRAFQMEMAPSLAARREQPLVVGGLDCSGCHYERRDEADVGRDGAELARLVPELRGGCQHTHTRTQN